MGSASECLPAGSFNVKVLVVHDRAEVGDSIKAILTGLGVGVEDIRYAEDGNTARKELQSDLFDLVVIDLTLPHMAGRTETTYAIVEELLLELFEGEGLNVPGDLIGITKDPKALENIDTQIGPHLMAIVEEDEDGLWRDRLADRIRYAMRASQSRQRSANQHFVYDAAIITALDKELLPYREIFELTPHPYAPGVQTFLFQDVKGTIRKGVSFAVGRAGQASSASATQALLTQFRPKLIVMSGFCGGLAGKTKIGRILIGDRVVDWDFGKWTGAGNEAVFVARPDPIGIRDLPIHLMLRGLEGSRLKAHNDIVVQASALSDGRITEVDMKLVPMASGSSLVADSAIIPKIQGLNEDIVGVDMEAYGFYYAAKHAPVIRPQFVVIKTVSDYCDRAKDKKDQAACSYLSAKVVEEIFLHRWEF